MPGPLADVDTIVGGVNLDVNRLLYLQDPDDEPLLLDFLVPDPAEASKFRTVLSLDAGFDMLTPNEPVGREGQTVTIVVADILGTVAPIITTKDLHVKLDEIIYKVGPVPLVPANEGQIYRLNCKVRNLRATPFDNTNT
jgi:hypothetical protein